MSKIFCIGLPHTGARAVRAALERLGYATFHSGGREAYRAVLRAKVEGRPLLHHVGDEFDAYSNIGSLSASFALADRQYPGSKFILTVRDLDSWLDSRRRHVERTVADRPATSPGAPTVDLEEWERQRREHHERVLRHFADRPHDLLTMAVFDGDGYERLCAFLDREVPDEAFPREPDTPTAARPRPGGAREEPVPAAGHCASGITVCPDPVFVIGCPRSGTSALARALARHSALWTSHESYFLHSLFGDGRARRVFDRHRSRSPSWLNAEEVDGDEFLAFLGLGLNALYTSRSSGRRWVEQTPLYTLMAEDLAAMFPGASFLHILRDGRSVVHSMRNFLRKFEDRPEAVRHAPPWASDLREACRTWTQWVTTATALGEAYPSRTLTVRNERLAAEPDEGFGEVLSFLSLSHEAGPARFFGSTRVNSSFKDGSLADRGHAPWGAWSAEEKAVFEEEAASTMVGVGLATESELEDWLRAPAEPAAATPSA